MPSLRWWTCLAVASSVLTPGLAAQQTMRGLSVGRIEVGSGFDRVPDGGEPERGWQAEGFIQWAPKRVPFGVRAEALYNRLTIPASRTLGYAQLDELGGVGAAVLWPQARPDEGFEPFLIAGGSVSLNRLGSAFGASSSGQTRWTWGPAWNVGAGFSADLFGVRTGLELRMHRAAFSERARSWVALSIPLLWEARSAR